MVRANLIMIVLTFCFLQSNGQLYSAKKSEIVFFSSAPIEDIKASNDDMKSVFNTSNGEIVFSIPISEFDFRKKLMKEHFNEKYMESDEYPNSTFKGKVVGYDIKNSSKQNVKAEGEMEIHGISKKITFDGILENINGVILLTSKFEVKLKDYKIKIPQLLWQNIAEVIEVTVKIEYEKYEK